MKDTVKHIAFRTLAALERRPLGDPASLRSFLILQHEAALGTAIHTTPLIPALRAVVPGARIVVAGSGFGLQVFEDHPGVDAVLAMPNPLRESAAAKVWLRVELPKHLEPPFATLTPLGNERTGIALATYRTVARQRVGFTLTPELYHAPLSFDPGLSQIANNLRLVAALGHSPAAHFEPQMFFSAEDLAYAETLVRAEAQEPGPLVAFVTQTSPTQRKSWRPERFVAAANFLVQQYAARIVFVGTAPERAAIDLIRGGIAATTWNVAGETDLQQLAALLSLCDIGLTLDTGTMHVGRAVGLPMAIVAPAWSPPLEWLPIGDDRFRILKNLDMPAAPGGYIIDEVSVDEVNDALADLLARYPRGSRSANS